MYSRCVLAGLVLGAASAFVAAQGGDAFSGTFQGKGFDENKQMEWKFFRGKDGTTLSVSIKDPPKGKKGQKILGLGSGKDLKLQGEKLEFTLQWSASHQIKGPADAKYVAEVNGDTLTVKWTAGNEKGELTAKNPNAVVVKKDPNKDKKEVPSAAQKVYLSALVDAKFIPIQKGTITQLGLVIPNGKASRAEYLKVTADTKFVVTDGDKSKTYDHKTVLDDPDVRAAFSERYVTLERQGNVAITVTATAVKKK